MLRPRVSIPVLMIAAMLLATVAPPAVGTTHDYGIGIDSSIDTVDRTVLASQGEFTATQVDCADVGDTVSVSVDTPSDNDYTITILDSEQRFRRTADAAGDASHEFGTGGLKPGTYVVVAGNQSTEGIYADKSLVIRAYAVSTQTAESAELSNDLDVTVELDEVESGESIKTVGVALAGSSENLRIDTSAVNDTHYSTSVSTDDVDAGDYSLYAVVRGDDQALDENELIGVSNASTVEVVEQSDTSTPDENSGDASGGGGGGGGAAGDTTGTATAEPNDTSTSTTDTVATTDDDEPSTTGSTKTTDATESTATAATDNVVTPNESTTTAQTTTSSEVPDTALYVLFSTLVIFAVNHRLAG